MPAPLYHPVLILACLTGVTALGFLYLNGSNFVILRPCYLELEVLLITVECTVSLVVGAEYQFILLLSLLPDQCCQHS